MSWQFREIFLPERYIAQLNLRKISAPSGMVLLILVLGCFEDCLLTGGNLEVSNWGHPIKSQNRSKQHLSSIFPQHSQGSLRISTLPRDPRPPDLQGWGAEVSAERFHLEAPCQASLPRPGDSLRGAHGADDAGGLRKHWRRDGNPAGRRFEPPFFGW